KSLVAQKAELDVVLQAQLQVAVADRRVMMRLELSLDAGGSLQQLAQLDHAAPPAAVERVEDGALAAALGPAQEVGGEVEAGGLPALRAGGVQEKDAERHRQPLAAVDDAHQVGVLQVVIAHLVALVAVAAGKHLGERLHLGVEAVAEAAGRRAASSASRRRCS